MRRKQKKRKPYTKVSRRSHAPQEYEYSCAWCGKQIPENHTPFIIGVAAISGANLNDEEGKMVPFVLTQIEKTVPVIVTGSNSEAKKDGIDMIFMTCSQECNTLLENAVKMDMDVIV